MNTYVISRISKAIRFMQCRNDPMHFGKEEIRFINICFLFQMLSNYFRFTQNSKNKMKWLKVISNVNNSRKFLDKQSVNLENVWMQFSFNSFGFWIMFDIFINIRRYKLEMTHTYIQTWMCFVFFLKRN